MPQVSAILTAAGESTRMGRLKPLLSWGGLKLVEYQVASLVAGGATEVIVVLGHRYDEVVPHIRGPGVGYVVNPRYSDGRTMSIKAGLARISPEAGAIVLLGVDQPRPPALVAAVIAAHLETGAPITSPRHEGRGGHPIAFSSALRHELAAISEEGRGLRELFDAHRDQVNEVEIDDSIVRLDLNTPEDYEEARTLYDA
jgi:molybdenum cofactor cytidylyltransferase